ncbi:hypothetical protein SCHPADRAFT_933820 [Schizopora paradoxa]|uniref:No apical meristem-associated C-terminal domain-containing protein n=1 Tax=Schizopora paradoxa TaxID=27342 RepID=A0A0H2R158_9AGAM|nr:hypothetical protein SCHPADRAFT_933820 [Schizopora paradoxa]
MSHYSVDANAEALRSKFVSHEGKETIVVEVNAPTRYHVNYDWMAKEMTKQLKKKASSPSDSYLSPIIVGVRLWSCFLGESAPILWTTHLVLLKSLGTFRMVSNQIFLLDPASLLPSSTTFTAAAPTLFRVSRHITMPVDPAPPQKRVSKLTEKAIAAQEPDELDDSDFDDVIVNAATAKARADKAKAKAAKKKKARTNAGGEPNAKAAKKAKAKCNKKKKEDDDVSDASEKVTDDKAGVKSEGKSSNIDINWDENTTWALVNNITDDDNIRQGLFPDAGGNVSTGKGGGKTKTEWHEILAKRVFIDHEQYGPLFARTANTTSGMKAWALKIKNRIQKLVRETQTYKQQMGTTGEGIQADQVQEGSKLENLWQDILQEFPYFAEMRELVGSRPNLNPVGIGNLATDIDATVLGVNADGPAVDADAAASESDDEAKDDNGNTNLDNKSDSDNEEPVLGGAHAATHGSATGIAAKLEDDARSLMSEDEKDEKDKGTGSKATHKRNLSAILSDDDKEATSVTKAKAKKIDKKSKSASTQIVKKEAAQPSGDLDTKKVKSSKKKKMEDQFSTIAVAEEATRQGELEVAKLKMQVEKEKTVGKVQIKKAQIEEQGKEKRIKLELAKMKMELKMERLRVKGLKYGAKADVAAHPATARGVTQLGGGTPQGSFNGGDVLQGNVPFAQTGATHTFQGEHMPTGGMKHGSFAQGGPSYASFGGLYDGGGRSSSPAMSTHSTGGFHSNASDVNAEASGSDRFDMPAMFPYSQ